MQTARKKQVSQRLQIYLIESLPEITTVKQEN